MNPDELVTCGNDAAEEHQVTRELDLASARLYGTAPLWTQLESSIRYALEHYHIGDDDQGLAVNLLENHFGHPLSDLVAAVRHRIEDERSLESAEEN
jgi:hypothetical protein